MTWFLQGLLAHALSFPRGDLLMHWIHLYSALLWCSYHCFYSLGLLPNQHAAEDPVYRPMSSEKASLSSMTDIRADNVLC